jgi:hypothetical protein
MNYELAKKLKDAGFPQQPVPFLPLANNSPETMDLLTYPTLEELIEACGEGFTTLIRSFEGEVWLADGEEGKTAIEAVANLWLELHKKMV